MLSLHPFNSISFPLAHAAHLPPTGPLAELQVDYGAQYVCAGRLGYGVIQYIVAQCQNCEGGIHLPRFRRHL